MSIGGKPDEPLAERWERLDRETLAEARSAFARGRRFRRLDLARAPLVFLRTLVLGRGLLDGTPGLIRAWMAAAHAFVAHLRIWALEHDAERRGDPG